MPKHATKTSFTKENPRPGPGRPRMTEQQRREARIRRAAEFDFKQECRQLLPLATDHVAKLLDKKDVKPDALLRTFEILRDSVHGRPAQAITGPDGGPLVGTFTAIVAQINGAKAEKLAAPVLAAAAAVLQNGHNGNGNGSHEKL